MLLLEGQKLNFRTLLDEVSVAPFISEKRLVLIDGTPKFTKEEVESLLAQMHPDCIVVVSDPHPDKRLTGTKALQKLATVKEFPELSEKSLQSWMQSYAKVKGALFQPAAVLELLKIVGENQDMLSQEIEKLSTAHPGTSITVDHVRALAVPSGEQEVWRLTNELAANRIPSALQYADALLRQGEDAFSLWSILLWMLRGLVSVTASVQAGERNPASIASQAGVPFPTVRTLQPLAQSISIDRLHSLIDWAANADIALKTGGYRATADSAEEVKALIDECIIRCGKLRA